jgi:hypothetical protein
MYVTNFQHFLNKDGNIPTDMPKEAKELANFLALLIDDASTGDYDSEPTIRCIEKGCEGLIVPSLIEENNEIFWVCENCKTNGVISNWRGSKWDNSYD